VVDLVAQYELLAKTDYEGFFNRFQRNNGELGVSIQIPLLTGSASKGLASQAQTDILELRTQMGQVRNRIQLDTEKSYRELEKATSAQEGGPPGSGLHARSGVDCCWRNWAKGAPPSNRWTTRGWPSRKSGSPCTMRSIWLRMRAWICCGRRERCWRRCGKRGACSHARRRARLGRARAVRVFGGTAALGCLKTASLLVLPLLVLLAACNTDPKVVSQKYVARGNQVFRSAVKYKEASILYRRALNKDLRSGDAWYRLGLVNAKLGALPEARKDFSRAMELDPANQDAVVQLGDLDLAFYLLDPASGRPYLADLKEIASDC
jgi:tetratricopeptide (TPR) repeat protein